MSSQSPDGKRLPVRVFGLTEKELGALRDLALKKYGKPSVSLLAKKLLQAQLAPPTEPELVKLPSPKCRKRITLRLPDKDRAYLEAAAEQGRSTINDVARDIIQSHIYRHPVLTAYEAEVLYQSNHQLLLIGRNVNQIARRMNAGENVSLSSKQIADLKEFIDAHTGKVGRVLQTNRRRKRE